jgi:tetratricopeptide (TPR) repeat protein
MRPKGLITLSDIVSVYISEKEFQKALDVCAKYAKQVEELPRAAAAIHYLRGNIYEAMGNPASARDEYETALTKDPNLMNAYLSLAQAYIRENRIDEAIEQYKSMLAKNPNQILAYVALGTLYDASGRGAEAEENYRKALEIQKDFGPAANNLAWNLADNGGNIDEALKYAQIAKEQMPDDASVMDTLGWIYYLKGSYLNAIAELRDSLERSPNHPVINYHLGLAYYKNNQPEKALASLRKALELDQDFEGAEEARKIVQELQNSAS